MGSELLGFPLKKSAGANAKGSSETGFLGRSIYPGATSVKPEICDTLVTHRESRFDLGQQPSLK